MERLEHVSTVFTNEPQVNLARKLAEITPNGALRKSFFTNSGTEANETAVLAARCYTGSNEIISRGDVDEFMQRLDASFAQVERLALSSVAG